MDPTTLNLLLGAGLALGPSTIAWVAGHRSGRTAARRAAGIPAALECSCGHGYGTHHDAGACSGSTKRPTGWTSYGESNHWDWASCPCPSYDGPEPLPRAWTPFPSLPAAFPLDEARRIG